MNYLQDLFKPFPSEKISWRVGSTTQDKSKGMALAYIDARDVMERLDEVCGIGGWQAIYSHVTANGITCRIGIKIDDEWIWKENGAGETQVEAEKGACSDAFKRAAVLWGIGRYLYDMKNVWVEIEPMGKSYRIKKEEVERLKGIKPTDVKLPAKVQTEEEKRANAEKFVANLISQVKKTPNDGSLDSLLDDNDAAIKKLAKTQLDLHEQLNEVVMEVKSK